MNLKIQSPDINSRKYGNKLVRKMKVVTYLTRVSCSDPHLGLSRLEEEKFCASCLISEMIAISTCLSEGSSGYLRASGVHI